MTVLKVVFESVNSSTNKKLVDKIDSMLARAVTQAGIQFKFVILSSKEKKAFEKECDEKIKSYPILVARNKNYFGKSIYHELDRLINISAAIVPKSDEELVEDFTLSAVMAGTKMSKDENGRDKFVTDGDDGGGPIETENMQQKAAAWEKRRAEMMGTKSVGIMDAHITDRERMPTTHAAQINEANAVLNNMQHNNDGGIDKIEFDMMQALLDRTSD